MCTVELVSSLRFLARRKAVAAVAVLTMACALGVNTAALAVLRAFLFSSLSVPDPDRAVNIAPVRDLPGRGEVVFSDAYPNYALLRETQRAFAEVAVVLQNVVSWKQGDDTRALQNTRASATFFATMRVQPILGRPFTAAEEGPSPAPVVVLSHALWVGAFNRDTAIIGKVMTLDGTPTTVIGVMPSGFALPAPTDIWQPFDQPASQRAVVAGGRILSVFGRIADGTTVEAARTDIAEFTRRAHAAAADNREYRYRMQSIRDQMLAGADATVLLIQVAAGCLLLLAGLNLVSLLVAWGFERNQEMAVRLALGGGRREVTRLLVVQGLLVVGAGYAVGVGLAQALLAAIRRFDLGPQLGFFVREAGLNGAVLLAAGLIALVVALGAGAFPAVAGRRRALAESLRASSRSASHSAGALRVQRAMVVVQAALSVVVLASAAVVGISFRNLASVPDGFVTTDRVVARVILPDQAYGTHAARAVFADALLSNLSREPALHRSAFTSTLPVSDIRWGSRWFIPDENGALPADPALLHFRRISPEYPAAAGITLLRGRLFTPRDDTASTNVVLISRAVADQYWPNGDAVGQRMFRAGAGSSAPVPFEIVGVVGNTMDGGYEAPPGQAVYVPFAQVSTTRLSIVAESRGSASDAIAAIRRAVRASDPLLAATGVATLDALVSSANALPQLRASLLLVFAVAAVLIAGLGSYGVMRQLVANREREFAVRLVFGAMPRDLAREVLLQVARLTVPGVVAGLAGAWAGATLLRSFVFGIEPRSAPVLAAVSAGVLILAVLAALPSVRRAMRLDPRVTTMG